MSPLPIITSPLVIWSAGSWQQLRRASSQHIEKILGVAILGLAVIWVTGHKKGSPWWCLSTAMEESRCSKYLAMSHPVPREVLSKGKYKEKKKRNKTSRCQNDRILYTLLVLINNLARSARINKCCNLENYELYSRHNICECCWHIRVKTNSKASAQDR